MQNFNETGVLFLYKIHIVIGSAFSKVRKCTEQRETYFIIEAVIIRYASARVGHKPLRLLL